MGIISVIGRKNRGRHGIGYFAVLNKGTSQLRAPRSFQVWFNLKSSPDGALFHFSNKTKMYEINVLTLFLNSYLLLKIFDNFTN